MHESIRLNRWASELSGEVFDPPGCWTCAHETKSMDCYVGNDSGEVWLWTRGSRTPRILRLKGDDGGLSAVTSIATTDTSSIAVSYLDGYIRIWSREHGVVTHQWKSEGVVRRLLTNGTMLYAADDKGMLHVFSLAKLEWSSSHSFDGQTVLCFNGPDQIIIGHKRQVNCLRAEDFKVWWQAKFITDLISVGVKEDGGYFLCAILDGCKIMELRPTRLKNMPKTPRQVKPKSWFNLKKYAEGAQPVSLELMDDGACRVYMADGHVIYRDSRQEKSSRYSLGPNELAFEAYLLIPSSGIPWPAHTWPKRPLPTSLNLQPPFHQGDKGFFAHWGGSRPILIDGKGKVEYVFPHYDGIASDIQEYGSFVWSVYIEGQSLARSQLYHNLAEEIGESDPEAFEIVTGTTYDDVLRDTLRDFRICIMEHEPAGGDSYKKVCDRQTKSYVESAILTDRKLWWVERKDRTSLKQLTAPYEKGISRSFDMEIQSLNRWGQDVLILFRDGSLLRLGASSECYWDQLNDTKIDESCLACAFDGSFVVQANSAGSVRVISADGDSRSFNIHPMEINSIAVDEQYLVVGSHKHLRIYDVPSARLRWVIGVQHDVTHGIPEGTIEEIAQADGNGGFYIGTTRETLKLDIDDLPDFQDHITAYLPYDREEFHPEKGESQWGNALAEYTIRRAMDLLPSGKTHIPSALKTPTKIPIKDLDAAVYVLGWMLNFKESTTRKEIASFESRVRNAYERSTEVYKILLRGLYPSAFTEIKDDSGALNSAAAKKPKKQAKQPLDEAALEKIARRALDNGLKALELGFDPFRYDFHVKSYPPDRCHISDLTLGDENKIRGVYIPEDDRSEPFHEYLEKTLSRMPAVECLGLSVNQINPKVVEVLARHGITGLDVRSNKGDVLMSSTLRGLPLKHLGILCPVNNFASFNLEFIESLFIGDLKGITASDITGCPKLKSLDFNSNVNLNAKDFAKKIGRLQFLEHLSVPSNCRELIGCLAELPSLLSLDVESLGGAGKLALPYMPNLKQLRALIGKAAVKAGIFLENAPNLNVLQMANSSTISSEFLEEFKCLEHLDRSSCEFMGGLKKMPSLPNLKTLKNEGCLTNDIRDLGKFSSLESLIVEWDCVSHLEAIAEQPNLINVIPIYSWEIPSVLIAWRKRQGLVVVE